MSRCGPGSRDRLLTPPFAMGTDDVTATMSRTTARELTAHRTAEPLPAAERFCFASIPSVNTCGGRTHIPNEQSPAMDDQFIGRRMDLSLVIGDLSWVIAQADTHRRGFGLVARTSTVCGTEPPVFGGSGGSPVFEGRKLKVEGARQHAVDGRLSRSPFKPFTPVPRGRMRLTARSQSTRCGTDVLAEGEG